MFACFREGSLALKSLEAEAEASKGGGLVSTAVQTSITDLESMDGGGGPKKRTKNRGESHKKNQNIFPSQEAERNWPDNL
jgi:hypothetical protein